MEDIIFKEECYAIQGAVFEVYRRIGHGFIEAVYQECMEREMKFRGIPFEIQKQFRLSYRDELLEQAYRADFVCYNKIILEIKAVSSVTDAHKAQVLNYLRMTGMKLGMLVNFGHHPKATVDRIINSQANIN